MPCESENVTKMKYHTMSCVHVHVCVQSMLCCGLSELLPTQQRDAEPEQQTCACAMGLSCMQMTVYTLNATLYILLCSACLLLDSKHTATHHLRLNTFLVQHWRKYQLPVHYLSAFRARTEHACQSHDNAPSRDVALGIHLSGQRVLRFASPRDC